MNQYVTGAVIKELRERYRLTQAELAEKLNISANMMCSNFYVCPVCGNYDDAKGLWKLDLTFFVKFSFLHKEGFADKI